MQLASVVTVDLGAGMGTHYITLQSARNGTLSLGQMTITYGNLDNGLPSGPEGTATSFFDVFFDVRFGALNGPIVAASDMVMTSSGVPWDANPMLGTLLVNGLVGDHTANWHTNKIDKVDVNHMDFST